MDERAWLAEQFEANRAHLSAVAYRMLGSATEADDAVQESWIRLSRTDADAIDNLGGWLTTVVGRVCLDMLRSRRRRREEPLDDPADVANPATVLAAPAAGTDPEQEAVMADSVGLALLVVLETLAPAERLAFVLHDMFAVPFEEIAPMVGRTPAAARQLASRARRRVQGTAKVPPAELSRQREVVDAYLAAARHGDFEGLLAVLDPDVVLRADGPRGARREVHGADKIANQALTYGARAGFGRAALVDGQVGVVVAPQARLMVAFRLTFERDRIAEIEVITEPAALRELDLAVLET
ncbi:MAG TPA: sigma-70 family RNA polymerase sigma factor [Acidimicrobiales bacterium]